MHRGVAQLGRALASGARGLGFESRYSDHKRLPVSGSLLFCAKIKGRKIFRPFEFTADYLYSLMPDTPSIGREKTIPLALLLIPHFSEIACIILILSSAELTIKTMSRSS